MLIIVKLFVILTLCRCVQGQCDDLKITNGNGQQVDTSTVCRTLYNTSDCLPFYQSFNQSDLPHGYPTSNTSVEKPADVVLDGLYSPNDDGYIYPGLSIRWKSPLSGTARNSCYGYLIVWFNQNTNNAKCRLFHTETGVNAEFRYDVQYVAQSTDYTVRVYSMPPFEHQLKNDERVFVYKNIMTSSSYPAGNPGYWSPFLVYNTFKNGTINVSFSLPPANFNITNFLLYLMKKNQEGKPVFVGNYITTPKTEENTQYFLTLNAKDSDFYHIVIWAYDQYHMQPDRCQCWVMMYGIKTCQNICGGTTTEFFYVNITEPPVTAVPTTASTTWSGTSSTPESTPLLPPEVITKPGDESNPDMLKYILGGIFACIAVVLILAYVCLCRNNEKVKQWIQHWFPYLRWPEKISQQGGGVASLPVVKKPSVPSLTRKTVYLMSAGDHPAHVELVGSFVTFLQNHCSCNVITPSDNDQRDSTAFIWFLNCIMRSDYFIFVNSEGAQKLIEAYLRKNTYTNMVDSEDDFFLWGLNHIIFNAEVREKQVILVSFHGNHCQQYLQVPEVCKLPKQLPRLLQKIHGLNAEATNLHSFVLPLNADQIPKLSDGARMLSAKKDVETYEKNNPNWFKNSFGDLKPQYNRLVSDDSGCQMPPDHVHLDSVSLVLTSPDSPTPDHLTYKNMCTVKNVGAGDDFRHEKRNGVDELSCITINEEHGRVSILQQPQTCQMIDGYSFIPPDTESKILDNFSEAVAQINGNSAEPLYRPLPVTQINGNSAELYPQPRPYYFDHQAMVEDYDFQASIIPPDDPSYMNVDSVSTALASFNDNPHLIHFKGLARHLLVQEVDNAYFEPEFDCVSI